MGVNGQRVNEGVREQQEMNLEEVNNSISETSSEIEIYRKDTRTQLDMIRGLMKKFRGSELTLKEKVATIFCEQGVTVAAVLTVIGTTIAPIIEGVACVGATPTLTKTGGRPPDPSKSKGCSR